MRKKKLIAMLLAGGQGSRLSVLTNRMAKPAVPFGGKYRIIDFPLSNCANSDIDTVGVLTQYEPLELNAYIGTGQKHRRRICSSAVRYGKRQPMVFGYGKCYISKHVVRGRL